MLHGQGNIKLLLFNRSDLYLVWNISLKSKFNRYISTFSVFSFVDLYHIP